MVLPPRAGRMNRGRIIWNHNDKISCLKDAKLESKDNLVCKILTLFSDRALFCWQVVCFLIHIGQGINWPQLLKSTTSGLKLSKKVFHSFTVSLEGKNLPSEGQVLSALSQFLRIVSKPGGMEHSSSSKRRQLSECLIPRAHPVQQRRCYQVITCPRSCKPDCCKWLRLTLVRVRYRKDEVSEYAEVVDRCCSQPPGKTVSQANVQSWYLTSSGPGSLVRAAILEPQKFTSRIMMSALVLTVLKLVQSGKCKSKLADVGTSKSWSL